MDAAVANLALVLLFPPYDAIAIGRGVTAFDAFYFSLIPHASKTVDWNLLWLEICWILLNAAIAWALLRNYRRGQGLMSRRNATLVFVLVNLGLMFLFPPVQNYSSALTFSGSYFDGFYFAFGDKLDRHWYLPLLYLEVFWLLINGAALWLAFRDRPPSEPQRKR